MEKIFDSLFARETPEIKYGIARFRLGVGNLLEVRQHFDAGGIETCRDPPRAYELARSEKQIDAFFLSAKDPLRIGFHCEQH